MGTVISFWGLRHRTGVTSASILQAFSIADIIEGNVLLIDTNYFSDSNKLLEVNAHKSIDTLINICSNGNINEQVLKANTVNISNNVDILPGTAIAGTDYLKGKYNGIEQILITAKDAYDVIIVDCNAGFSNDISTKILNISDIIVNILEQDTLIISEFMTDNELFDSNGLLPAEKTITVVNKYEKASYPTAKEIEKLIGAENIAQLAYCPELRSAINSFSIKKYYENADTKLKTDVEALSEQILNMEQSSYIPRTVKKKGKILSKLRLFGGK